MGVKSFFSICSLCHRNTTCLLCFVNPTFGNNIKNSKQQIYSFLQCEACLLRNHMPEKTLPCISRKKYFLESYYRMQDRSSPQPSPTEPHSPKSTCTCESCQQKFSGLQLLANVVENIQRIPETKPEPQKTEIIDTSGPSTSYAKQEKSLKSPKTMNCEHCSKVFTHRGDLNKHLRRHTGEQPYECPVCQRKFTHTSNLARHIRVHSGDRPFHCDRCNRDFSRKDKLVMHQKTKLCQKSSQRPENS